MAAAFAGFPHGNLIAEICHWQPVVPNHASSPNSASSKPANDLDD
jgi:hypothetical protein